MNGPVSRRIGLVAIGNAALACVLASASHADPSAEAAGKKACVAEARTLCPAEMKSMRRKRVEACMIAQIDRTSAACHAAMLKIKAAREASSKP
jgi:hypothetical protein